MNRPTDESGICTNCEGIAYCRTNCFNKQIYDRLKEYEDTGLPPEKIEYMKARLPLKIWLSETPEKMSIFGITVAELIELSNLKKQERLSTVDRKEGLCE